jgi:putative flippase GtrA
VTLQMLIVRYAGFSVLATIGNLMTQRVVLSSAETGVHFAAAVGAGTIVGLVIKYLLDKRWIFYAADTGVKKNSRMFSLYAATGVITTGIFWGTETAFWLLWQTDMMRELGAILGLSVGYVVKYNLDRRFVFTDRRLATPT